jgi:inositol-phosphate transport system permease protein
VALAVRDHLPDPLALKTYFGHNQWGYGAAWGFVLVIIGIVMSIIYLRVFRFNELVQEPKIDVL